jgi:hypothetical protein
MKRIIDAEQYLYKRVRINSQGVCYNETGEVIGCDGYTLEIRLDRITEEMKGYGDTKRGIVNVELNELTFI